MPDYTPTAGTVTEGFCPSTWQDVIDEFAPKLPITVPTADNVLIQEAEPSVDDRDKLWIELLAAAPWVKGAKVYTSGAWRYVPGLAMYFVDAGSADAISITTGESIPSVAFITGRLFLIRVLNANTGATTLAIDSVPAKTIKKKNATDLVSGDIASGQLILVAYDSTSDNYEILTTLGDAAEDPFKVAVVTYTVSAAGAAQQVTTTDLTVVNLNTSQDPQGLVVGVSSNQIELPSGTYTVHATVPVRMTSGNFVGHLRMVNDTAGSNLALSSHTLDSETDDIVMGVFAAFTLGVQSKISLKVKFSSVGVGLYLGNPANLDGLNETYAQVQIIKVA